MLVAIDSSGARRVAGGEGPRSGFTCPDCKCDVVMRAGQRRVPHFAHQNGTLCTEARLERDRRKAKARRGRKKEHRLGLQGTLFDLPEQWEE